MKKYVLNVLFLLFVVTVAGQNIPVKPNPPRLVNDFAGVLTPEQMLNLERKLVSFNDSTSTQIAVVTVSDLGGMDIASYSYELAKSWGIGQEGKNNGVLMLVRPKVGNERGQARIEVGYGLEGAIPDAIANRIIDNNAIPFFKVDDYYGGINEATDKLMGYATGEFKTDAKNVEVNDTYAIIAVVVAMIFVIVLIRLSSKVKGETISGDGKSNKDGCLNALLLGLLVSNIGRGGHSSGGFGGGGFGGFGGGGFGGGGASGSW